MKRQVIFAHYDIDGLIDDYVVYYLQQLRLIANNIIVVSTAPLLPGETDKIKDLATVIVRENIGYDFYSWKTGLQQINLDDIDELVICNDSVYAPLYRLDEIFDLMSSTYYFWGITDTSEHGYHLQSYFVVFTKPVISSQAFKDFWTDVEPVNGKMKIVQNYEVKLTEILVQAEFKCGTVDRYLRPKLELRNHIFYPPFIYKAIRSIISRFIKNQPVRYFGNNPALYFGGHLIKSGVPIVKVALLRDNPRHVDINDIKDIIETYTRYDYSLIENHLARVKRIVSQLD